MGSISCRKLCVQASDLVACKELIIKASKEFENEVFEAIKPVFPLDIHQFNLMISRKMSNAVSKLNDCIRSRFVREAKRFEGISAQFSIQCKAKEGFFRYINSVNSLIYAHHLKIELLQKDLEYVRCKLNVLQNYSNKARGCFALQGLSELEQILITGGTINHMILQVFKQTFEAKKSLDSDLLILSAADECHIMPELFESYNQSLQISLYSLSLP